MPWIEDLPLVAALVTADTLRNDIYNVSNGTPYTGRRLVEAVQAAIPGAHLELRPGRNAGAGENPYLDITRLTTDTGFTPSHDLTAAVADYVAWRADHDR